MSIGVLHGQNGGKGAALTVTAPAGSTVAVSKDGKTLTRVAGADGVVVFRGLETGTWNLSITDGEQTASKTVEIVADYATSITFFEATIHITYPAGSTCTVTDGATTLTAPDTSGTWDCVVPNSGEWTVSLDNGFSEVVSITANAQEETIDRWYLYKSGDEYTARTGGWEKGTHTVADGLGTVTKNTNSVYFHTSGTYNDDCPLSTLNKVDLSKFSTLYAEFVSISGASGKSPNLWISYLSVRGLKGSNGATVNNVHNGSSSRIIQVNISNVSVPYYVNAGINSTDANPVTTAYLTSVWAV